MVSSVENNVENNLCNHEYEYPREKVAHKTMKTHKM